MNNKRIVDWYKTQKDVQGWNQIPADLVVAEKVAPLGLRINFDYCHYGLKNLLGLFEYQQNTRPDFFIITDIELSKKPMSELFSLYQKCYQQSRCGIYVAALSYYLEPDQIDPKLSDSYAKNIETVFQKNFSYADQIENYSVVQDYPLEVLDEGGNLIEGANYIFVHPNIRYFLWKNC